MNCQRSRGLLQELLDEELRGPDRAQVQTHFAACPSCARRYETLKLVARGVQSLPLYQVSAHFSQKVLAALGHPANRPAIRPWMKAAGWAILFLVSGWSAFLVSTVFLSLDPLKMIRALEFLLHPQRLPLLARLWALKAGVALIHFMPYLDGARRLLESGLGGPQGAFQILLSSLLAGALIFVLSRNTPIQDRRKA